MSHHGLPCCLFALTFVLAGLSLLGYALNIPVLYSWGGPIRMAPSTAIAFVALSTAGLYHLLDHKPPYDNGREDD